MTSPDTNISKEEQHLAWSVEYALRKMTNGAWSYPDLAKRAIEIVMTWPEHAICLYCRGDGHEGQEMCNRCKGSGSARDKYPHRSEYPLISHAGHYREIGPRKYILTGEMILAAHKKWVDAGCPGSILMAEPDK